MPAKVSLPEQADAKRAVSLSGVPETMLWPLHNRAAEARRPDARLHDPHAVRIADAIDYDYERSFGKANFAHALRALVFDDWLRQWLRRHPDGQVVALGEGLETQFHRVDNGSMRWLSVDVPAAIEVRRRFLPDNDRLRNLACSALDFAWMEAVEPGRAVFVTAQGLLMYFTPEEVRTLVSAIAARFPAVELEFDVIPRWFSKKTLQGLNLTRHYTLPRMPWGIDRHELGSLKAWHPDIVEVRERPYDSGRGLVFGFIIPLLCRLPGVGSKTPAMVHVICKRAS